MKQVSEALKLIVRGGETGFGIARTVVGAMGVAAAGTVEFITVSNRPKELEADRLRRKAEKARDDLKTTRRLLLSEVLYGVRDEKGKLNPDGYHESIWGGVVLLAAGITLLDYEDEQTVADILDRAAKTEVAFLITPKTSADIPAVDSDAMERLGAGQGGYRLKSEREGADSALPYPGGEETEVALGHS